MCAPEGRLRRLVPAAVTGRLRARSLVIDSGSRARTEPACSIPHAHAFALQISLIASLYVTVCHSRPTEGLTTPPMTHSDAVQSLPAAVARCQLSVTRGLDLVFLVGPRPRRTNLAHEVCGAALVAHRGVSGVQRSVSRCVDHSYAPGPASAPASTGDQPGWCARLPAPHVVDERGGARVVERTELVMVWQRRRRAQESDGRHGAGGGEIGVVNGANTGHRGGDAAGGSSRVSDGIERLRGGC